MRLNNKIASLDVKLRKLAPGVTIPDNSHLAKKGHYVSKRYRIADAFKQFIWKTMPRIEEKIELKIIYDLYHKMNNPVLQKELIQAYKRRLMHIESLGFHEFEKEVTPEEEPLMSKPNIDVSFKDMKLVCEELSGSAHRNYRKLVHVGSGEVP
jgi:hypothetical protein